MIRDIFKYYSLISPGKCAIEEVESAEAFTYQEINHCALVLASKLQQAGVSKGDRVCILAGNCIEYIILFAAAMKTGVILVPLNYRLTPPELSTLIHDVRPGLILYEEEFAHKINDFKDQAFTIYDFVCRKLESNIPTEAGPGYQPEEDDAVLILYTSGSTGIPKGVIYTYGMMFWNSINTHVCLDIQAASHTLVCMPLFHTGGWNVLLTPYLHKGASVSIMRKFDSSLVLQHLRNRGCDIFMAVPTMLNMMSQDSAFDTVDLSTLKFILVGGEATSIELIHKYQAKGIPLRQGFGMTEAGPNLTSLHHEDAIRKIGSIGKPNMYVAIKLIDTQGKPVESNQRGQLLIKGPIVTPGYWSNEEATRRCIKDGWLYSGDVAKLDDEGYLYIVDRIKNMYISGGENVYPAEIERILATHPKITEAAVIGVPDKKWGEVGHAFVSTAELITTNDLTDFLESRLSKFKIPKHYSILTELPKNAAGKIDRKRLQRSLPVHDPT